MTQKDLWLLYRQEKGIDTPEVHNAPEVQDYIEWLEEHLVSMTNCVDGLTACLKKATAVMNRHNPQIN